MSFTLAIACDHAGFELKEKLKVYLSDAGIQLHDLGVHTSDATDYPEKAHEIAETVLSGKADRGILVCGTGIGMSIAANRHKGIHAALCTDPDMAKMARQHNDANILCLGGRVVSPRLAVEIVDAFLNSDYEGGRHARRLQKVELK